MSDLPQTNAIAPLPPELKNELANTDFGRDSLPKTAAAEERRKKLQIYFGKAQQDILADRNILRHDFPYKGEKLTGTVKIGFQHESTTNYYEYKFKNKRVSKTGALVHYYQCIACKAGMKIDAFNEQYTVEIKNHTCKSKVIEKHGSPNNPWSYDRDYKLARAPGNAKIDELQKTNPKFIHHRTIKEMEGKTHETVFFGIQKGVKIFATTRAVYIHRLKTLVTAEYQVCYAVFGQRTEDKMPVPCFFVLSSGKAAHVAEDVVAFVLARLAYRNVLITADFDKHLLAKLRSVQEDGMIVKACSIDCRRKLASKLTEFLNNQYHQERQVHEGMRAYGMMDDSMQPISGMNQMAQMGMESGMPPNMGGMGPNMGGGIGQGMQGFSSGMQGNMMELQNGPFFDRFLGADEKWRDELAEAVDQMIWVNPIKIMEYTEDILQKFSKHEPLVQFMQYVRNKWLMTYPISLWSVWDNDLYDNMYQNTSITKFRKAVDEEAYGGKAQDLNDILHLLVELQQRWLSKKAKHETGKTFTFNPYIVNAYFASYSENDITKYPRWFFPSPQVGALAQDILYLKRYEIMKIMDVVDQFVYNQPHPV